MRQAVRVFLAGIVLGLLALWGWGLVGSVAEAETAVEVPEGTVQIGRFGGEPYARAFVHGQWGPWLGADAVPELARLRKGW